MSNTAQYVVGLLVVTAIAALDNYVFIESASDAVPQNMVWIDGSEFADSGSAAFTDRDTSQDFQRGGFWIDSNIVSEAGYQEFLDATGYVGTTNVKPQTQLVESNTTPARLETIFALGEKSGDHLGDTKPQAQNDQQRWYISRSDALAYCHWKGLELSSRNQSQIAAHYSNSSESAVDITLHASQPMSDLSGFRCVKVPQELANQANPD